MYRIVRMQLRGNAKQAEVRSTTKNVCTRRYNKSQSLRMGCIMREGVRRNALRVLCPKSPHSEESAQHIEWRIPRGYAAVWLQGSVVQGRHDRQSARMCSTQGRCSKYDKKCLHSKVRQISERCGMELFRSTLLPNSRVLYQLVSFCALYTCIVFKKRYKLLCVSIFLFRELYRSQHRKMCQLLVFYTFLALFYIFLP